MANAITESLHRYGVKTDPFATAEDDGFFFSTPALAQRLDLIQHLIEFSGQPVLVLGEEGSGKTTLLRQIRSRAGDLWRVCHIEAHETLDGRALLELVMDAYGLYPPQAGCEDLPACIDSLKVHLDACTRSSLIPVLFVDDAQKLPTETLALLLSLIQPDEAHAPPRLTLFSEPALKDALNAPPLSSCREGIMHVLDMPALTKEQTVEYIRQRMARAGHPQELMPDDGAIHRIHMESGGLPGRIQRLVWQALSANEETPNRPGVTVETSPLVANLLRHKWQLAIAAGLLAVVSLVVVINSQTGDAIKPQLQEEVPLNLPPPKEITPAEELAMADPLERERALPYEPLPDENAKGQSEETPAPKARQAEITPLKTVPGPTTRGQQERGKKAGEAPAGLKPIPGVLEKEKSPTSQTNRSAPLPATSPPKSVKTPPKDPTVAPKPTMAAAKPPRTPLPNVVAASPVKETSMPEGPGQYVLQLFGSHDKAGIDDLLAQHGLRGKATIMSTTRNGRPWYVAVVGPFPDRNKAQAAKNTLPPGVQALKPWPRTTASLRGTGR